MGGQEIMEGMAKVISLAKFQEAMTATPKAAEKGVGRSESGMHGGMHDAETKEAS